jgi:hypothetical protein
MVVALNDEVCSIFDVNTKCDNYVKWSKLHFTGGYYFKVKNSCWICFL